MVDWELARRSAVWLLQRKPAPTYDAADLQRTFDEVTAQAEDLVEAATGLRAPTGPARARVADRPAWVVANLGSIQRLLGPTLEKLQERQEAKAMRLELPGWMPRPLSMAGRAVSGAQLGAVLAWMSTRVLGQYDLLLTNEAPEDQDLVYYLGPNVVEIERRHDFVPRDFRLWLALHEVTHRCQFTAIPWLRDHFVSLVDKGLEPLAADPHRLLMALRRSAEEIRAGRNPLDEAGVLGLVATPEQREALDRIQALMSLLEGHGDVTMDRAGAEALPDAPRYGQVLRARREQVRGPARLLQRILGLEAKLRQYADGDRFIHEVEAQGGPELLATVWQGPEWLPTLAEVRNPTEWIERVRRPPPVLAP
jgi:coenzyme F420 biosynthesis associated uncharacterized protein